MFARLLIFLLACCSECPAWAAPLTLKDDYRSPRNKERPFRKSTKLILLHTTEAHARSSLNKLSERGEAHYCVTEKGEVYRIIDRDREAFHAGRSMWNAKEDCDEFSVGIEVVGFHDKTMPLVQLAALKELVDRLKKIYNLGDMNVICHSHVAYGAPNTWHKKKHRGRKRCGMLFAMPSVRNKLGLKTRPAFDPDVRAKRLVQADSYLNSILYGRVDTMAWFYNKDATPLHAAAAPKEGTVPTKKTGTVPAKKSTTIAQKGTVPAKKPGTVPEKKVGTVPEKKVGNVPKGEALPLPKNLYIGKMGDDVRDLAALASLPGYTRGGPVSGGLSPYKIAGAAWKSPTTYYYGPRGKITTGDKIDEKSVEAGTFIFYKK